MPHSVWRSALIVCSLALASCAHGPRPLEARAATETDIGQFDVEFSPADEDGAAVVRNAVAAAAPKLARWGKLNHAVRIEVMPTHDDLEKAVDRIGYGWLRAWARWGVVYVQSPRSWSLTGASQAQMNELMLHELTHCVMYQQAASETEWQYKGIPIWFREGMASVTADQAYRRGTLGELSRWFRNPGARDPISDAEALYQRRADIVYTTGHHLFAFLTERYGDDGVRHVLAEMAKGKRFDAAFEDAIGLPRKSFEDEFRRYVRMEGFRAQIR